jgi:EAL domain-containing protein (putative c-di-GMP-specific phosphodiesterase class I)
MQDRRSPTPGAMRKREAIHELTAALAKGRVELHYQPLVQAAGGAVAGVEALLRWKDKGSARHALADLIWAAERSPVIFKLENWILEQAFHAAGAWKAQGLRLRVNVNVSAREFARADLVRRVSRLLRSGGLDPHDVGLEITETSGLRELDATAEQLDGLMAMGIELWLDDFGTGHSSLEWLRRLPVHGLKVAGDFVNALPGDARTATIVTSLIELAHDLGLRVIAEGVENEGQRAFLCDHGCDLLQGFLLFPPLPLDGLPAALARAGAALVTCRP